MHTCRTGHLSQSAYAVLYFARSRHHQVGKLVYNNDYTGQGFNTVSLRSHFIVAFEVTDVIVRKELVSLEHFLHSPRQSTCRLSGVGDNGDKQVGNTVIYLELNHLGVDKHKPYLVGACVVENAHYNAVGAYGFT